MQRPERRSLSYDEANHYEYPSHLREALAHMPAAAGVYVFRGQEGDLPL